MAWVSWETHQVISKLDNRELCNSIAARRKLDSIKATDINAENIHSALLEIHQHYFNSTSVKQREQSSKWKRHNKSEHHSLVNDK
jgi:hypothetical protein